MFIDQNSCEGKCQALQDCCDNNCGTFIECLVDDEYCENGGCEAEIEDAGSCLANCGTLDYGFEMADANEGEGKFLELNNLIHIMW